GAMSGPADVDRLLADRAKAKGQERLLFETALFASRSPKAIPLLVDYVKTSPNAVARAGALVQLGEMMPPADYHALLEWVSRNDADPENRSEALEQLRRR
ncbi:MAG: hypothetical protein KGL53_14725, partial [Elusimicrobia bacterium]|nr:hypothetical protein [Elusimicrobiota bacterium]